MVNQKIKSLGLAGILALTGATGCNKEEPKYSIARPIQTQTEEITLPSERVIRRTNNFSYRDENSPKNPRAVINSERGNFDFTSFSYGGEIFYVQTNARNLGGLPFILRKASETTIYQETNRSARLESDRVYVAFPLTNNSGKIANSLTLNLTNENAIHAIIQNDLKTNEYGLTKKLKIEYSRELLSLKPFGEKGYIFPLKECKNQNPNTLSFYTLEENSRRSISPSGQITFHSTIYDWRAISEKDYLSSGSQSNSSKSTPTPGQAARIEFSDK